MVARYIRTTVTPAAIDVALLGKIKYLHLLASGFVTRLHFKFAQNQFWGSY